MENENTQTTFKMPEYVWTRGKGYDYAEYDYPFLTRESYLEWRASWRVQYRELADSIREQKTLRKNSEEDIRARAMMKRESLRKTATKMLEIRVESKKLSQRMKKEVNIEKEAA
jgi:hypothetical protein